MSRKHALTIGLALIFVVFTTVFLTGHTATPGKSHGIDYPKGWQSWSIISISSRTDNQTMRAILGNKIAVEAAHKGQTNPWPDGTILAKVVWKTTNHETWTAAKAPGKFVHVEFMVKDSKKFAKTYGWGWARWVGMDKKPFNDGSQICIACHTPVKNRDWVFTNPAQLPE